MDSAISEHSLALSSVGAVRARERAKTRASSVEVGEGKFISFPPLQ
jgi:hypothetical protein